MLQLSRKDELACVAMKQIEKAIEAKSGRMKVWHEIYDLYNNKTIELEGTMVNIPFPILSSNVDLLYSKIDNPPTLEFKVPNRPTLSEKVKAAWTQESSSVRAGWSRKDRAEKKLAILTGRGISKIYASSVNNKYKSHYDVVDPYSFLADPTRGTLEEGNYHGETDIFKTKSDLEAGVKVGIYSKEQVAKLFKEGTQADGNSVIVKSKFDRLKALGIDVETTSFAGQSGTNLTEWIMKHNGEWFYLLLDPITGTWIRAEELRNVFKSGVTPYTSWATHYDEYSFWSKSPSDDIYPVAEAIRLILNTALENEKRRTRPMRIVDAGAFVDVSELQDYVPDNVIVAQPSTNKEIITIETPEITTTLNLAQFFDTLIQNKSGMSDPGVNETDPKVGVFYGKLQQEADRIGIINKEYSESYAHKGYRFFWGMKEHLTGSKVVEMLGGKGIKLQELTKFDFTDVDDVDDVIVSGGSAEAEMTAVDIERKMKALEANAALIPNQTWVARETLKLAGYKDDEIDEAMDAESQTNRETIEEADQAIQDILLGNQRELNQAADTAFAERIITYVREELNWVKLDKDNKEIGIDKDKKEKSDKLLAYVAAHQQIITDNMVRKQKKAELAIQAQPQGQGVNLPPVDKQTQQQAIARPFEGAVAPGTPQGTQAASQKLSAIGSPSL